MKISIGEEALKFAHSVLERSHELFYQQANIPEGDEWKRGSGEDKDPELFKIMKRPNMGFCRLELARPLHSATMQLHRSGDLYHISFGIQAVTPEAFSGISSSYDRALNGKNKEIHFVGTTMDVTGYIYKNRNDAREVLVGLAEGQNPAMRILVWGSLGAMERKFPKLDDFKIDVGELLTYTNILLDCVYEPYKDRKGFTRPDITLYCTT